MGCTPVWGIGAGKVDAIIMTLSRPSTLPQAPRLWGEGPEVFLFKRRKLAKSLHSLDTTGGDKLSQNTR